MKILVLSSGSYKSPLAMRIIALAQHLAKQGETVTLIAPSADKYNKFVADKSPSLPDVTVVQPWQFKTKSAMLNLVPYLLTSTLAILRRRVDVVYLCKPTPITIMGLLPRLLFRTPIILDLDDLGAEVMKAQGQSALQYTLVNWCEKLGMRFANGVVVASTYLESWVKQQYPNKPIMVIPNAVAPGDYQPVKPQAPRHAVYYFGVLNRLALIETLLRSLPAVIQAVPDTKITIAGGGSALPEAKQLVHELGITQAVTFTDWINFLDIQNYTQYADVAVCCQPDTPTVRAASIMKIFQYMAMGSAPIVSDVGDLGAYVQHGLAGIVVPPEDPEALAQAIIDLLKDDNRRLQIAQTAHQLAQTTYSWDERTKQLLAFMRSLWGARKS